MSGGEFRRRGFQRRLDRLHDLGGRLGERVGSLFLGHANLPRDALHQVAALHLDRQALPLLGLAGDADLLLDPLGGGLADQQVMVPAHVGDDGLVHLVAPDPHGARVDDAGQAQHRHLGGAAADVDHHGALRLVDRQSRRRSRPPSARRSGPTRRAEAFRQLSLMARRSTAVAPDGTHTITLGFTKPLRLWTLRMKCLIISSATSKSADHPVAHGADRLHVARRAAEHLLGLGAHGVGQPCGRRRCEAPPPTARSARYPCPSCRSGCWRCRGRWRCRWRSGRRGRRT